MEPARDDKRYRLDDRRNVTRVFYALVAVCALLLAGDFFYDKYGHFAWEGWFGFHGFYGFAGSVLLVLAARLLRRMLMREDDYYDR